jgi:hypothetical protein
MKKLFTITFLITMFVGSSCFTDAFVPMYFPEQFVAALSIEKIFSWEKHDHNHISLFPWLGAGIIWPFYLGDLTPAIPALGLEGALEGRVYPLSTNNSGLFGGVYVGGSFMFPSYVLLATSIGAKVGGKVVVKERSRSRFAIEPYLSVSTSPLLYTTDEILYLYGVILTAGVRFTSEWHIPRKTRSIEYH